MVIVYILLQVSNVRYQRKKEKSREHGKQYNDPLFLNNKRIQFQIQF